MRTLVAIPSMDQVPAQFAQSLAMLQKVGEVAVAFQVSSLVYTARNQLAMRAIGMGTDYVLWLDSDMVFPSHVLEYSIKTMEEKNIDILSGLYYRRVPPYTPVLYKKVIKDEMGIHTKEFDVIPNDIFIAEGIGFGCVCMKTSVLIDVFAKHHEMFSPLIGAGEDISFCIRAKECGIDCYVDPQIALGHMGQQMITREFAERYTMATNQEFLKEYQDANRN